MRFTPVCRAVAALVLVASARAAGAAETPLMDDAAQWRVSASDQVSAKLRVDGGAPCLVYDFGKVSGYASLRRDVALEFPENYTFTLRRRGSGPPNAFQFKLGDASGENVWWVNRPDTTITGEWEPLQFRRRHIEFAWGPTADKTLRRSAAIEFTMYAGQGGSGELCIADLVLHALPAETPLPPPRATATTQRWRAPAALAVDGERKTAWRASARRNAQVVVDFGRPREFGGLLLHWLPGAAATDYVVERSNDARAWQTVRRVEHGNGGDDALWLPESEARYLRLTLSRSQGREFGLAELDAVDVADGITLTRFLRRAARDLPRGTLPRGFHGEQSYWTLVGTDGARDTALIGEDGAIELGRGGVSIEPFLLDDSGNAIGWAGVELSQSLAENYLPLPRVGWRRDGLSLYIDAFATAENAATQLHARYTVRNEVDRPQRVRLALALRPFQVNAPTQFLTTPGGVSPIPAVSWNAAEQSLAVDGAVKAIALSAPSHAFASRHDSGFANERFAETPLPPEIEVRDGDGLASAALLYDIELAPRAEQVIGLVAPLAGGVVSAPRGADAKTAERWLQTQYERSAAYWRERLDRVELVVPAQGQALADSVRSALAHILLSRDGPVLRPGTRSYARSWIRDGAMIAEGLLRLGDTNVAREYLEWFAPYQFQSGKVPCCVDARGADPVPENDSHGEFVHLAALLWRYGGDADAVREHWPRIRAAIGYMDGLRAAERDAARTAPERRAFAGLMPASISHEGYSAKPMHSYWDDFWALTGYKDAAALAQALALRDEAKRLAAARDEFRRALHASLQTATAQPGIDYLPGCAELGDFDPTSTTIALSPAGEQAALPQDRLRATFERYWNEFVARRDGSREWNDYTPYEWRNVSALVRLGWRERAWQAAEFFLADRRPRAWNQWAEVVGREPREPRFIGDMPHAWVSSDFIRAALDLFAYERYEDQSFVLAAGIPAAWLEGKGIAIRGLRTPYGGLNYSLWRDRVGLKLVIDGTDFAPPGGVRLPWPIDGTPGTTTINGKPAKWNKGELTIVEFPARVEIRRLPTSH